MITFSVQSGSCGNCYYYESREVKLLFDAGVSWRTVRNRLAGHQVTHEGFSGLFLSHDHSDHVSCAGVLQRALKVPMFVSPTTWKAIHHKVGHVKEGMVEHFTPGDTVEIGHVKVHTLRTPHDAHDPCIFVVDDGQTRVGIFTDLGSRFKQLEDAMGNLDVVFLESNYDDAMLASNHMYPEHLKRRIRGAHGHLENRESALLLAECASERLQVVLLSHLSGENNTPRQALETHREFQGSRSAVHLMVAPRDGASTCVQVEARRHSQQCFL